jgi:hypothetical protein
MRGRTATIRVPHVMRKVIAPLLAGFLLSCAPGSGSRPLPRLETGMHTAAIRRIATDAAGHWAVTASDDKTARVWEVASGRQFAVLRPPAGVGYEGKLYAVALSPSGAEVAVGGSTTGDEETVYLFERVSGRLLRRLVGLPNVIHHLAFSPDGRFLAASFGASGGVRIFDATHAIETWRDTGYGGPSYSAHFSPDGRSLLTTSYDGQLRLYAVNGGKLGPRNRSRPRGGKRPFAARFSPDGRHIAVGFEDSTEVQVLDAETLKEVARPSNAGTSEGNLAAVAWSADGRFLMAAGRSSIGGKFHMRRWRVGKWSQYDDVALSNNTVMDLASLPGGGLLFAAADPAWGFVDAADKVRYRRESLIPDLRGPDRLRVTTDGRRVRFSYRWPEQDASSFDLATRGLGADIPALPPARTAAPGLEIRNWDSRTDLTLNGQRLPLEQHEISRSLSITPDAQRFVVGSEWYLRMFDRTGRQMWRRATAAPAWAVNVSLDGRFAVAAYGDGTIRWHRLSDGHDVLALFAPADHRRWIAWTPEGFFATSGPDAEELLGYQLNYGKARRTGEFISASQLREQFYQPGLISQRLDGNGDALVAKAVSQLGDVRWLLAGLTSPAPAIELLSDAEITTAGEVRVKVHIRDQGGGVSRLNYRIDGTELEGRMVGVVADGTESRSFPLAPGRREITVTATNARGVESLPVRIMADVRPRPAAAAPSLHVLAVGVSLYRDHELQKGVRFAAGDAEDIAQLFRERGARLYKSIDIRVLTDREATGAAIRAALEGLASRVAAEDVFILYLAGHGASFDRAYHFIPWDAVYTSTAALRARSLTHDDFRALLARISAAKTVVLLDTCSAGGFGRQEGRGDIGEKDAIDRLSRLTGRAMIAATADDRLAIEGEGGHGAFTFALLEGLRGKADRNDNGTVEVGELGDFVEELLPKITLEKWGYEQFPFRTTEGASFALVAKP